MKKRSIAVAAIVFLCGCGVQKEPLQTDIIETEQPESFYTESSIQTETQPPKAKDGAVSICGTEYEKNAESLVIDMNSLTAEESGSLEELSDITSLRIYNVGENNIDFIGQFKKLEHISLWGCNGTENCIAALKKSGLALRSLYVNDNSYSGADGDALFTAFPSTETLYMQNSDEWNNGSHDEGFVFYAEPSVNEDRPLRLHFTNHTDKTGYVSGMKLLYCDSGHWEPAEILNGEASIDLGLEIPSGYEVEFTVPAENFDFENARSGRYTAVCYMSREEEFTEAERESEFFIFSLPFANELPNDILEESEIEDPNEPKSSFYCYKAPDFLDEAQLEAFNKAYILENIYFGVERDISEKYAKEHTGEDIISALTKAFTYDRIYDRAAALYFDENGDIIPVSAGGRTDLSLIDMEFFLIYSNDDEVLFKAEMLHGHEDDPYFVWFSERNFHMIMTDDGWRFDSFSLWY